MTANTVPTHRAVSSTDQARAVHALDEGHPFVGSTAPRLAVARRSRAAGRRRRIRQARRRPRPPARGQSPTGTSQPVRRPREVGHRAHWRGDHRTSEEHRLTEHQRAGLPPGRHYDDIGGSSSSAGFTGGANTTLAARRPFDGGLSAEVGLERPLPHNREPDARHAAERWQAIAASRTSRPFCGCRRATHTTSGASRATPEGGTRLGGRSRGRGGGPSAPMTLRRSGAGPPR